MEGGFAITSETTPPLTSDPSFVLKWAALAGLVHTFNITDGAGARAHPSRFAAAHFMQEAHSVEGVMQFTTRVRNKLALERDLIGVAGFAIPIILCLTGYLISRGGEPKATAVNDVDSAGLVAVAIKMRDAGLLPSGREIKPSPQSFIGVADMPFDTADDWRPANLLAKIVAGADFDHTQF